MFLDKSPDLQILPCHPTCFKPRSDGLIIDIISVASAMLTDFILFISSRWAGTGRAAQIRAMESTE